MARRWSSKDIIQGANGSLKAKVATATTLVLGVRGRYTGRVLGIDPSLRGTGLALVEFKEGQAKLLFSQTLKTKGSAEEALGQIAQSVSNVCRQYKPDAAAIEETIFAQNHKTAITLGASRGAVLATLALNSITTTGFAPTRIKQSVVGNGRASKEQVARMVKALLKLPDALPFDEADAAAAALCFNGAAR